MTGFRTWSTGDSVSAADFTSYIATQSVLIFADASARSSAVASPVNGMVSSLTTDHVISIYNGSAWVDIIDIDTLTVSGGNYTVTGTMTYGASGSGVDVTFHSGTSGDYLLWDSSEEKLILEGTNGATVLDVTDGNVAIADGTLSVSGAITATGGVTGNVSGSSGSTTGNAATATALETARNIGGVSFDGTAAIVPGTITVADTTDTTCSVALFESATGDLAPKTDGGATYNAGTGTLTATAFAGALTGNVTGNASGTAATVTGAAQSAITSVGTLTSLDVTGAVTAGSVVAPLAINAQTGTTYTFVLADAGKMVTSSNGSAQTLTVPPNSSVAYATGTQIIVQAIGSGTATLAEGSGVTINSKDSNKDIDGQYAAATLIKTATDAWSLIGALA